MEIAKRRLAELNPAKYNPRKDLQPADPEYQHIKNSIETFGYIDPIIVNVRNGVIVGGHQRYKILLDLGYDEAECVEVDMDEQEEMACNAALNKAQGDWDEEKLDALLSQINAFDMRDFGFDLDLEEEEEKSDPAGVLNDRFGVAPLSIINTTGQWLARKKAWIAMGIRSEESREGVKTYADSITNIANDVFGGDFKTVSIFDPMLCETMYKWFCPVGGSIFDPFAGGSVRGIVASQTGHPYLGIDLRQEQVDANRRNQQEVGGDAVWICDDSRNQDAHIEDESVDMVFTCPPYADLEVYSNDPRDISNKDYPEFLELYTDIMTKAARKLKNDRFLVIVVGEARGKDGAYYNFVSDTVSLLQGAGLTYYDEMILSTPASGVALRVTKSMNTSRKVGKRHQNILVFYKGNLDAIPDNFGYVTDKEDLEKTTFAGDVPPEEQADFDPALYEIMLKWFNVKSGSAFPVFPDDGTFHTVIHHCGYTEAETAEADMVLAYTLDMEPEDIAAIGEAARDLKDNRFLVVIQEEKRSPDGAYYNLIGQIIDEVRAAGLAYYNEIIYPVEPEGSPESVAKAFNYDRQIGHRHKTILVFYKGNNPMTDIRETFGDVAFYEDLLGEQFEGDEE